MRTPCDSTGCPKKKGGFGFPSPFKLSLRKPLSEFSQILDSSSSDAYFKLSFSEPIAKMHLNAPLLFCFHYFTKRVEGYCWVTGPGNIQIQ